jgi:hypothetical protein
VIACAALFMAAPAQAGGEFRDGFEDQLGRLAALEVFHLGHILLAGHASPYYEMRYAQVHYVPYEVRYAPHHQHHHYKHHHKHPRHHVGHHRHHHGARHAIDHSRRLHRGRHVRAAVAERRAYRHHEHRDGRGRH